ncbi:FxDxF family PEP-CTERM protein [Pseudoduganella sp. SL102]|uniref:FxDxF family PEP-CTERM protein n=1 Tax=Pseudoduganella sp. SL102 TaxID=2995154 RepID=UPI00248C2BD0|nr:FxDxF family PEP-CTERM protein [Pseudoduganella sp. SL102]WBS02030.1 FxDxF family PEP-CTERM protein [Pseudoduganella sp. SL102]
MTNMKNIAASLALACAAMGAQAADVSLPAGSVDIIDGAGAFSRLITGNHSGDTFTDTYAFDVAGLSSFTANLYSSAGNARVGLDITGFSLFANDGSLVRAGTQIETGKYDEWSLDLSNLGSGAGYYVAVTGSVVSQAAGAYSGLVSVSAVPEPATYGMLLGGMALLGVAARRRSLVK